MTKACGSLGPIEKCDDEKTRTVPGSNVYLSPGVVISGISANLREDDVGRKRGEIDFEVCPIHKDSIDYPSKNRDGEECVHFLCHSNNKFIESKRFYFINSTNCN